jgi:hypothetical protein
VTGLDHFKKADDLRVGLQKRPGVYYVSLESWDLATGVGRYEVLARFDVQRFLPAYVDELRLDKVKVQAVSQNGQAITARKGHFD